MNKKLVLSLTAILAVVAMAITGCTTTTSTSQVPVVTVSTNSAGVVTDTTNEVTVTVTNKVVNPIAISVSAGVLQIATAGAVTYIVANDTSDIVYLQGCQAALTLAIQGTNVNQSELTSLLANVKVSNPAVSDFAQAEMDSIALQYESTYGQLVAQGIDANAVAGPLLKAVLAGLDQGLVGLPTAPLIATPIVVLPTSPAASKQ